MKKKRIDFALILCIFLIVTVFSSCSDKSLTGLEFDFTCQDSQFKNPFVDVDEVIKHPVKCRYIHGGFDDGTLFSFYFPLKEKDYTGRFFQYITPFPDSEKSAQAIPVEYNPIIHAIVNGAYFVETNEGGALDFNDPSTVKDASIGAYRANAACAEFSRHIAQLLYDCERPYGYCYGGSGGAYRTAGGMESTEGVWDGAVPYVMGSPQAIPNVFAARMHALRILRDKMDDIVDALEPGGSGDPYATLDAEQKQVLQEVTRLGFPIKSWYGWKYMDAHGFLVLYRSVVAADQQYFREDFWNKPGYLGYTNPPSLQRDHIQQKAVVTRIIGQLEAEKLRLVEPISEEDRGSADRAWASMGTETKVKPVACEIDREVDMATLGGELMLLSGKGKGDQLQITAAKGRYVTFASVNDIQLLSKLNVGDSVQVDNSDWIAVETYYRHQLPTEDYYAWNQFRDADGQPIYPQRPMLLGPLFTQNAAGCLPTGKIHGKMILCCSVWDREAFAWQGDWYRKHVQEYLGDTTDDNFRLWYIDRCTHGEVDDPTEVVDYFSTLYQALLDLSDWVERGIEPSPTTAYKVDDTQVILSPDGASRGGIQPVPYATVNGKERTEIKAGGPVTIHVSVDVPKGTGKVVKAEWCLDDSKEYTLPVDLSQATFSADGEHLEFDTTVSYDQPGTYFPTVKVWSERKGRAKTQSYVLIPNLAKVRVVVKTAGTVGDGNPDKPKVSVGKLDFYPGFESASGLVTPRNVYVWIPDNYDESKEYAVVYMSDGQNLFDPEKMFNHQEWRVDETFGGLITEGRIQDCIVVGVANSFRTRSQEYFPQDVFDLYSPELKEYSQSKRLGEEDLLGNNYLKFLVEELKPFIDKTYSTRKDRNHTFHMGSSMGGLISSYAVAKYPEVFGGAGCLSTHSVLYITNYDAEQDFIDPANQCYVDYLRTNLKPNGSKIYMDRGDQTLDAQYPKYQDRLDRMFKDAGWDNAHYVSKVYPGLAHVEDSWASRLDVPVLFLLGK